MAPSLWPELAAESTFKPKLPLATGHQSPRCAVLVVGVQFSLVRWGGQTNGPEPQSRAVEMATKGWVSLMADVSSTG